MSEQLIAGQRPPSPKLDNKRALPGYDMALAVEAGVLLLNKRDPQWESRANLKTLNMFYHGLCLLSQLFGSFADGIEYLGLGWPFWEDIEDWEGWDHGFTLPPQTDTSKLKADYARLTKEWRKQIVLKRLQVALQDNQKGAMTNLLFWLHLCSPRKQATQRDGTEARLLF